MALRYKRIPGEVSDRFAVGLKKQGVVLPLRFGDEDSCTAVDANGHVVFTVDVNREMPDLQAEEITVRILQAINVCGGFILDLDK